MSKLSRWAKNALGIRERRLLSNDELVEALDEALEKRGMNVAARMLVREVLRGLLGSL